MTIIPHNGENWVLFSAMLEKAGNMDASTANRHADRLGIERTTLPGSAVKKYIRVTDIPRLLRQYSRLKPEGLALLKELGEPDSPEELPGQPGSPKPDTPDNPPGKKPGTPTKKPGNTAGRTGQPDPDSRATKWGLKLAAWYASPLTAYLALTLFAIFQAWLHKGAAVKIIGLGEAKAFGLMLMMQSVIVLGTVNSSFWGGNAGYQRFLWGFFLYDLLMVGGNFFYDFNPALSSLPTQKELLGKIIEAVFRGGLSIGFPLAQIFFASLVKKIS